MEKYSQANGLISHNISCRQKNPTQVFTAIKITEVGVATFSEIRNNKVSMEKVQMSTPEPAKALQRPKMYFYGYSSARH